MEDWKSWPPYPLNPPIMTRDTRDDHGDIQLVDIKISEVRASQPKPTCRSERGGRMDRDEMRVVLVPGLLSFLVMFFFIDKTACSLSGRRHWEG